MKQTQTKAPNPSSVTGKRPYIRRPPHDYAAKMVFSRWRETLLTCSAWNKQDILREATEVVRNGFRAVESTSAWASAAANDPDGHQHFVLYTHMVYEKLELIEYRKMLESHGEGKAHSLKSARRKWQATAAKCDKSGQPCPSSGHQARWITDSVLLDVERALQAARASALAAKTKRADSKIGMASSVSYGLRRSSFGIPTGDADSEPDAKRSDHMKKDDDTSGPDEAADVGPLPCLSITDDPGELSRRLAIPFAGQLSGTSWEHVLRIYRYNHEILWRAPAISLREP